MKIKSNNSKILYIFCICFAYMLVFGTIAVSISNSAQLVFSQGYIPPPLISPPTNSIQPPTQQPPQPSQSMQLQQQPPQEQQLQPQQQSQPQNGPLTTTNNMNTLGPLGTELKDRLFEKLSPCANVLTGKWIANDGGVYYIKQDGNKIRWFGSTLFNEDAISTTKGFSYSNAAFGLITDPIDGHGSPYAIYYIHDKPYNISSGSQVLLLSWKDINISDNHLTGSLHLNVDPSHSKMVRITETGGFGPSEWTRKC